MDHDGGSGKHSFLGMLIQYHPGEVEVDMEVYLWKVLEGYNNLRRKRFLTTVARLLYLSKHARPDILMAVGFLCMRVKEPTEEDQQKLLRLL